MVSGWEWGGGVWIFGLEATHGVYSVLGSVCSEFCFIFFMVSFCFGFALLFIDRVLFYSFLLVYLILIFSTVFHPFMRYLDPFLSIFLSSK